MLGGEAVHATAGEAWLGLVRPEWLGQDDRNSYGCLADTSGVTSSSALRGESNSGATGGVSGPGAGRCYEPTGGCPITVGLYACSASSFCCGTNLSHAVTGISSSIADSVSKYIVTICCG
jgi:hypothetical protein